VERSCASSSTSGIFIGAKCNLACRHGRNVLFDNSAMANTAVESSAVAKKKASSVVQNAAAPHVDAV
jgi:hypothetical protein